MIIPGLPIPTTMHAAYTGPYTYTSGGEDGFIREGGVLYNDGYPAAGSEQGTLLDGFVVDAVTTVTYDSIIFQGDARDSLSDLSSFYINEEEFVPIVDYNPDYDITYLYSFSNWGFTDGATYVVELEFE